MSVNSIKLSSIFVLSFFLIISFQGYAQLSPGTLSQQYDETVNRAGSYNGYKNIRLDRIQRLWKNVTDSVQHERQLLNDANLKLASHNEIVSQLKTELDNKQEELTASRASVNEMSFLGISLTKPAYNTLMWGLILALLAAVIFSFLHSKTSLREARYRNELYSDLFEEFREYRSKSNEKEVRLARELQTERNKVAELTGK